MSTTLPFDNTSKYGNCFLSGVNKLVYVGSAYVGADVSTTWTSSDGLSWVQTAWVGGAVPNGAPQAAEGGGYTYGLYHLSSGYENFISTSKTSDFLTWVQTGSSVSTGTLDTPGGKFTNASIGTLVVKGGVLYLLAPVGGGFFKVITSTNEGASWALVQTTNLLISDQGYMPNGLYYVIISAFGSLWTLPKKTGGNTLISTSSDGITWSLATSDWGAGSGGWKSYSITNAKVTVVLANNATWETVDMINWTQVVPAGISLGASTALFTNGLDLFSVSHSNNSIYKLTDYYTPIPIGHPL